MKKIFLFLFVISLILCFSLPVFASESYIYYFDSNPIFNVDIPTPGNYSCLIEAYYLGSPAASIPFTASVSRFTSAFDSPTYYLFCPPITFVGQILNLHVMWVDHPDFLYCGLMSENNDLFSLPEGFTFKFTIEKINNPSFVDSVQFGLSCVLLWIQSFVSAFLAGQLSPLLSVFVLGICIAALFLAVRYIYKSCWGC